MKYAERLARELGEAGFGIVSGLARGIDAAAHRASLRTGTIAVLAGGHEWIYPVEYAELLNSILAEGVKQGATLVTEAADVIAALEPIMGRGMDLQAQEASQEMPAPLEAEPGEDERTRIIALLGPTPSAIDDLVRLSRTSPAIVRTVLLELKIAGRLERHGGALVSLQ